MVGSSKVQKDASRFSRFVNNPGLMLPCLLTLVLLVYAQTLSYDLVYDDLPLIADSDLISSLSNIPKMFLVEDMLDGFNTGYYRPLISVLDSFVYAAFGASPMVFHLISVLYHLAVTALLYFLALRLLGSPAGALVTCAFFALHPVNVESVAFVSAKNNMICAIFSLGAMLLFLKHRDSAGPKGSILLAASAAVLFMGTLSKEFALMTPFVLLSYEWIAGRLKKKSDLIAYIPMLAVVALYLLMRSYVLSDSVGGGLAVSTMHLRLASMGDLLASYLRLSFFPFELTALYDFKLVPDLFSVISALGVLVLLWASFFTPSRWFLAIPVSWFLLYLAPVMNLLPIGGAPMAERYMYLPLMGVTLFTGALFSRYKEKRFAQIVSLIIIVIFALLSFARMPVWKTDEALYTHMASATPQSYKGWYNLGVINYERGDLEKAGKLWEETLKVRPDMYTVHNNLGVLYERAGKYELAEEKYRLILSIKKMAEVYINLANSIAKQGRTDEAEENYREAIKMDPASIGPYMYISRMYETAGQKEKAISILIEATKKLPSEHVPYNTAGILYADMGRYAEAELHFLKALELSPSCMECVNNLKLIRKLKSKQKGNR
jgi:tetratricopeptide (TPR) repeat protein